MMFIDPPALFYIALIVLFTLLALYKLAVSLKSKENHFSPSLAFVIYTIKACSVIIAWWKPYENYSSYFTTLACSLESILAIAFLFKAHELTISEEKSSDSIDNDLSLHQETKTERKNFKSSQKILFSLVLWNIVLFIAAYINANMQTLDTKRLGSAFIIGSYLHIANAIYKVSTEIQSKAQTKLDIVVTSIAIMGVVTMALTTFPKELYQYNTVLEGMVQFFEAVVILFISKVLAEIKKEDFIQIKETKTCTDPF